MPTCAVYGSHEVQLTSPSNVIQESLPLALRKFFNKELTFQNLHVKISEFQRLFLIRDAQIDYYSYLVVLMPDSSRQKQMLAALSVMQIF